MRVTQQDLLVIEQVGGHFPQFVEFLKNTYNEELRALPGAQNNVQILQGRCLMLEEILNAFNTAARVGKPSNTARSQSYSTP